MKLLLSLIVIIALAACAGSGNSKAEKRAFQSSAVLSKYRAIADNNDIYFEIRENNFFEFYMKLFDSVKNTRYAGKYNKNGDTLLLNFYDKKGAELIGRKALASEGKKEIIFFDDYPRIKSIFAFNP